MAVILRDNTGEDRDAETEIEKDNTLEFCRGISLYPWLSCTDLHRYVKKPLRMGKESLGKSRWSYSKSL